jgi:murein DD-endopeptidase MepM/ murein hydrolase activator NlpD
MFGLALSVGASSLVLPHRDDGANAAEPKGTEVTAQSLSQIAALPVSEPGSIVVLPSTVTVEHVVREGQTLSQIARSYRVNVQDISATNLLAADALLKPGQVLKIPVNRADGALKASSPELVASADLSQAPVRPDALTRLREQRDKLKDSLAELRSEDVKGSAAATSEVEVPIALASQVSEKTEEYRVQPGDTVAAIARAHGVSERILAATNNLSDPDWIRVSDSLNVPAPQSIASDAIQPANAAEVPSATAQPSVVQPSVQQVAVAPQTQDYRVGLGDTVARIAKAHNVPLSALVDANRLSDPNVIFVGQVLRLPNVPTAPVQPVAVKPQAVAIAPRAATPAVQSAEPGSAVQREVLGSPDAIQAAPRYVENLLAEVRALRAKHQGGIATRPAQQPVMVTARSESIDTVAPQSAALPSSVPSPVAPLAAAEPDLVAAASISSESYAPLRQPVTGRTVSPELPPLPGAEAFLPEGSRSNGYIWPTRGLLTSGYGWRWGRMHAGIDIAADTGTPIYAAASGVVQYSDWNSGGYGNMVEVVHPDGSFTRYAHLNRSMVREGQRVQQGEQIAEMGSTGYSTGPHLHFEVHPKNAGAVNPIAYLPQQSVQ